MSVDLQQPLFCVYSKFKRQYAYRSGFQIRYSDFPMKSGSSSTQAGAKHIAEQMLSGIKAVITDMEDCIRENRPGAPYMEIRIVKEREVLEKVDLCVVELNARIL